MKSTQLNILFFVALKFLLHLLVNLFTPYEIFRDELYYLACADHPALGYVDQPPLSIWLLMVSKFMLGDSLFAVRLIPALTGAMAMYLVGKITVKMGGKGFSVLIACLSFLISPIILGFNTFYSMNILDIFFWLLVYYTLIRIIETQNQKFWINLGFILGLALLNKISTLWLGVGLLFGLILTPQRKWLLTPWPYIAGAVSFLMFSPYLIWNMSNDWAHLEFIENARSGKYGSLNLGSFWSGQILLNNPVNLIVWVPGLLYAIFNRRVKKFRMLLIIFISSAMVLSINGNSKSEYLAAALSVLYCYGGVFYGTLHFVQKRRWARLSLVVALMTGLVVVPIALPMLPPTQFLAYETAVGIRKPNDEGHEETGLPQFLADMQGWENQARQMASAYHSLPETDQKKAYLYGSNYGKCGAIDYYSEELDIPKSIGSHNAYWTWGYRDFDGSILIVARANDEGLEDLFESWTLAGSITCDLCMPYETGLNIYICRNLKGEPQELWEDLKYYQ